MEQSCFVPRPPSMMLSTCLPSTVLAVHGVPWQRASSPSPPSAEQQAPSRAMQARWAPSLSQSQQPLVMPLSSPWSYSRCWTSSLDLVYAPPLPTRTKGSTSLPTASAPTSATVQIKKQPWFTVFCQPCASGDIVLGVRLEQAREHRARQGGTRQTRKERR